MKRLNSRGFSYIEMLAVIVIIGMFLLIAIPSISRILTQSRKQAYLDSILIQKNVVEAAITSDKYYVYDKETVYYFDYKMFDESNTKGKSPFGDWVDCYVVVTYDGKVNHFYWTGLDTGGWKVDLRKETHKIQESDIYHSNSTNFIPGNTIGARDNIVIYKAGSDDPVEQTPSNDVSYEDATRCFTLEKLSDGTYSIIDYNKACGSDVGVPSSVDGNPVTVIGENAFMNKGLTSVVLYYGITELKNGAFQGNSIKDLKLSSTIKIIGPYAFYNNQIEYLDLPDGVEKIYERAFQGNRIRSISFPRTLTYIGELAFYGNLLTEIELKSSPSIKGAAFSNNQMPEESALIYKFNGTSTDYTTIIGYAGQSKNVVIPASKNGVAPTTIAGSAFNSCGLTSITMPDSITTIEGSAFYANNLTSVKLPANLKTIGGSAFRQNFLKSVEIPASVTSIGNAAFVYNCFPSGSDIIYARNSDGSTDYSKIVSGASGRNDGACSGGTKTLNIPASKNGVKLRTINSSAFQCCYYTKINLPNLADTNGLTIGSNAFYHNSVSASDAFVYRIANGVVDYTTLDSYAGSRSGQLVIPEESHGQKLKTINASFTWTSFTKITIPSSVTTISGGQIFCRTNVNNPSLRTIVNKTGKAFDWYYLTCSSHTKPNPAAFVTGTVSHQSKDVTISAN